MSAPARGVSSSLKLAALFALCTPALNLLAQGTPTASAEEPSIKMDDFTVVEKSPNPYQASQAVSGSRIAMAIQNIPQTVSVVTSELIQDSLGQKILDVAKYVTPIVESTLPFGGDRYMVRGFQVSHEFIDGVEISGADGYSMSMAQYNIDRVEIIKGPNAILVPGGSPGGQMNPITKAPIQKDQSSVTLELAQYMGNAVSADVNRVINAKRGAAVRVVAAAWRNEGYIKNQYRNGYMVAPSFCMNLAEGHKLVVKSEFLQNRETNLGGLPIDPLVGSNDYAYIARGLPRNWSFGNDDDSRHRTTERITAELFSTLSEHISSRLQLTADEVRRIDVGGTGAALKGISTPRDAATGLYTPVAANISAPSTWVFSRNNGKVDLHYYEWHLKNDYSMKFENTWVKSATVAGYSLNSSKVHFISYPAAPRGDVANNNLSAITYPAYAFPLPAGTNGTNRTAMQKDAQAFIYENASFFKEMFSLSAGLSRYRGTLDRLDNSGVGANPYPHYKLLDTAKTLGAVYKPIKELSLFYGFNTSGGTMPGALNAGTYAPSLRVADGSQHEFGLKTSALNGRLTASVSHFDIKQKNYAVPNSEYYTLVAQGVVVPNDFPTTLYLDLNSKGYEFEGSFSVDKNLTILGNYTTFEMRQPVTNVRVRAVPDHAGGIYVDYRFDTGALKGFGFNLGADYKSDVVGENATGYTQTAKPPFIANQPTFKIAGRSVVNVGIAYRAKDWTARVSIANAFDKDYILAAGSRTSAVVADPRNIRGSITYKF